MLNRAALCLALSFPAAGFAQNADSLALVRRATQISALLAGTDMNFDTVFAPAVRAQLPDARLKAIATQFASFGKVQKITMTAKPAPTAGVLNSALFQFSTDKGYNIPTTLVVDQIAPNLVSGLLFGAPVHAAGTLDDALKELRALHGHASFFAARLDGSKLVPLATEDTARAMGIGSAFKLYVLAELVREIEAGKRHWADVVQIDSNSKSLPSGFLQTWPAGTPVTLQTLATLMISISDNTAADHLLHILGRENVERVQSAAGHSNPPLNEPFLATREMFVLKSPDQAANLQKFIAGKTAERRAILTEPGFVAKQKRSPDFSKGPIAIESVEWFATTPDLARVMIWLRDHSASGPGAAARGVLSVNKGIDWPPGEWNYVGFKGGSEPGVLNLTFIAQRKDGQWMVFVGTWNDPAKPVDEIGFVGLITRLRDLVARQ